MSHGSRSTDQDLPEGRESPSNRSELLDQHRSESDSTHNRIETDPILSLRGLGSNIWTDENADHYVKRLREGWQ